MLPSKSVGLKLHVCSPGCLEKNLTLRGSGKEKNPEMYPILGDLACCAFQEGFQEFRQ